MESLNISDAPLLGGLAAPSGTLPHVPAQLPPQMFTTAAQLLDLTDSMTAPAPVSFYLILFSFTAMAVLFCEAAPS